MADELSNRMVIISDLEKDMLLHTEYLSISLWQELVAGIGCVKALYLQ